VSAEPGIPLSVPVLRGNEAAHPARCVADNRLSSAGSFVVEMECQLARLIGRAHGVAMVNGTAVLHLALVAAGSSGSEFHRDRPFRPEEFVTVATTIRRSSTGFAEAGESLGGYGESRHA
jgi:dTDP-4-amino-4,6-dideoxygalactose transaminase